MPSNLSPQERKMAEAIIYYLEIGSGWCFIEKQLHRKRNECERLVCLYREEQKEATLK